MDSQKEFLEEKKCSSECRGPSTARATVYDVHAVDDAENDDVYAVDEEMTLCMGLPMQQKL